MKVFLTFCFCILFIVPALAQTFESKGNFKMTVGDAVQHFQMLNDGKTLLLVGGENAVFWNVQNETVSGSSAFENNFTINFGAVSPDGRKVLSLDKDIFYSKEKQSPAFVFDLHTGKRILKFDEKVVKGFWSENGKVLVTADQCSDLNYGCPQQNVTFTFRDGDSLEKLSSVTVSKRAPHFLSRDGQRFFTISRVEENGKTFSSLDVWNTQTGRLEQNLVGENGYSVSTSFTASHDKNLIGVVAEKKSDKNDRAVFIYKMNGNDVIKYEIKSAKKITSDDFTFSLDEKSVAVDTGGKVQFYDIASGEKLFESGKDRVPDFWIADKNLVIYRGFKQLRAYRTGSENPIYSKDLFYEQTSSSMPFQDDDRTVDWTATLPNSNGRFFMLASNRHLRIFDSESGEVLQTLVEPEKKADDSLLQKASNKLDKLLNIETGKYILSKTVWSKDYRYILSRSYDNESVYVWERKD